MQNVVQNFGELTEYMSVHAFLKKVAYVLTECSMLFIVSGTYPHAEAMYSHAHRNKQSNAMQQW